MWYYHGGNLDRGETRTKNQSKQVYGSGLYLSTSIHVALKWAKGPRTVYFVEIGEGTDLDKSRIPFPEIRRFLEQEVPRNYRKEVEDRLERFNKGDTISGIIFNNIITEGKWANARLFANLSLFYNSLGIDYCTFDNLFGWGETTLLLYNMSLLKKKIKIGGGSLGEYPELLDTSFNPKISEMKQDLTLALHRVLKEVVNTEKKVFQLVSEKEFENISVDDKEEFIKQVKSFGYKYIGEYTEKDPDIIRRRERGMTVDFLLGSPKFSNLVGPMRNGERDGKLQVRYETGAVNDRLSV